MRVLFASGIDGFCHRYAVLHWAEQLATQAVPSTVRAHTDPRLAADLATHDVLVLYRVPDGAWARHLLARARALGRATVFAVDDLIFDPAVADPPPVRGMDAAERRLWHDGVVRYRRTLDACDAFLTTTAPLAAAGRQIGKPTYLHRCGLAARELALGAAARGDRAGTDRAPTRREVRLGYFSGTATHDEDFATIAAVLRRLVERDPSLTVVLAGPVTLDPALAAVSHRVERLPLEPWTELPARIASVDVNLAPLAWRDPFVAAKGAVKYLEAAAVGVPTVASPTEAFRDAIRDGENGLLAADDDDWIRALTALADDAALRVRLGAAARADVAMRFAPATQGRALRAILEEIAAVTRPGSSRADGERRDVAADETPAAEVALARRFRGEVARAARAPNALPDAALEAATVTPPLADGVVLEQRFRVRRPGLTRVDMHTVTYGLPLEHDLELRLRRADGSLAAAATIPAAVAPDRDWLALELEAEADSADRVYALELRAHGTGPQNALAFGATTAAGDDGPYSLGDRGGPGSLALRTFAIDSAGVRSP